ncbi:DNA-binding transcriptional regulator, XRE-family HTH domain [Micromonospora viridifaciens]|uniref:DNA-binding transcriptional regulator, XRE-family HTH domain n=1 Tax=Micromonospora viridifaciens TaxID=1881 RepID=A0A1C4UI36_MICVI|nr:helix-turn-helix transcriptional regulator [Micromonospora viridifaciens]SCE71345.1 DNA-binding transcriptional regulator, XRE-family HTH domain [Micromonospora viridifaciens]
MKIEMWIRALKAARAGADVSQEGLATLIKWSPSTVAAIETGRRRPTMEFALAADQALGTGGLLANLLEAADRERGPSWFVPWRGYEQQATRLRAFEACLVPGLLQTEDYARAVISTGGLHPPAVVDELVAVRMERQQLLQRDRPPHCVFLLDETAVRRPVGGPAVLDAQLGRLLEVAELSAVRLHVIPLAVGEHAGLGGGFVLAELPDGERVLYLENAARGHVVDDPETIGLIERKWDSLLGEALSTGASLDLIRKLKVTP